MKYVKKIIVWMLSLVLLCSAAGCGSAGKTAGKEDPNTYPEETYEINWYINAKNQPDVEQIETEVNKILKEKINCTLKLNILDSAQYNKKMSTMVSAGEYFDLAYTSSAVLTYADYVRSGAFFDMSPYLDEYMPKTKALFDERFFSTAYVDGQLGAIPCYKEYASQIGWIYRKDIADKYNIDMSQYKNLEDLKPLLQMIKEKEPDIEYPMEWDSSALNQQLLSYIMPSLDCVIYLDEEGNPSEEIQIFPDTDKFKQQCSTAHQFYNEGLVKPDALTATDAKSRMSQGKAFMMIASLKPGGVKEAFPNTEVELAQQGVTPIVQNSAQSAMIGLSATSKNPYRVMRFLELLYNDKEISNLIVHGIEGKHYTKIDENIIHITENAGYDLSAQQWMMGNVYNNYLTDADDPQKYEKYQEFSQQAIYVTATGFSPDLSSVELEKVSVSGVKEQYRNQVMLGTVDPEVVIPEYIAKLKEAGIDKIIEEMQKQYDVYMSEQK